jgi:nucleotide-binding universal stress UspA family protein
MISLAYDGSINGDWVSRYAIRLAVGAAEQTLLVVHVAEGGKASHALQEKLDRIESEASAEGLRFDAQVHAPRGSVTDTLVAALPGGRDSTVVCGTRARRGHKRLLAGTVALRLLRRRAFNTLAFRVVQPGLLGHARHLLVPVSGRPGWLDLTWPMLGPFLGEAEQVHLLRVMAVNPLWMAHLADSRLQSLRRQGWTYLHQAMSDIERRRGQMTYKLDGRVVVSGDWPREVLVHAAKLKARLVLIGASERTLVAQALDQSLERLLRDSPCDVAIGGAA